LQRTNIASKDQIIESTDSYNIVIIGAGNVSTHISRHFHSAGHRISCVFSRTEASAQRLAREFGVPYTSKSEAVPGDADFYIIAVPDRVVVETGLKFRHAKGTWLHTAGSLSMDVFKGIFDQYGVLYPLQTLSRSRPMDPSQVPCLVEGSSPEVTLSLMKLAASVYETVEKASSEQRLVIHAAAVFANNFSNHMVHIARQLLSSRRIDPVLLDPLLEETYKKIITSGTLEGRTGPAVRGDQETITKHLELLKDHPEWEKLYTFISRDIERTRE
jgi:predicted short-subunit dehydrogenase-like oxidoreductase (DUF2520 family)